MSKLKEFINLLPKGIKNADGIVEGLVNKVKMEYDFLSDEEVEEITRRRLICQSCPFNSFNAKTSEEYQKAFGKPYTSDREDLHCSVCTCVIDIKTACLDCQCGIQDEKETENLELKWIKFK